MKLPKSWADVTIKNYILIQELIKKNNTDKIEESIELLSILTGETQSYFENLDIEELKGLIYSIKFINSPDVPKRLVTTFRVKGKRFDVSLYLNKLKAGQYTMLMDLCKDQNKINENLHQIMAVLCVPRKNWFIAGQWDGSKHIELSEFLKENMTMEKVFPLSVFFLRTLEKSMEVMQTYLTQKMKELQKMLKKEAEELSKEDLQTIGDGGLLTMLSRMETELSGSSLKK